MFRGAISVRFHFGGSSVALSWAHQSAQRVVHGEHRALARSPALEGGGPWRVCGAKTPPCSSLPRPPGGTFAAERVAPGGWGQELHWNSADVLCPMAETARRRIVEWLRLFKVILIL